MASASVREWSSYTKFLACVIIVAGIAEIVVSFVWRDGFSYGLSGMAAGGLYIFCGISGIRAGIVRQLSAARQYFRLLVVTAVALSVMEIIYLGLTNVLVRVVYGDCDYYYNSCDLDADSLRLALLISGFITLGITLVCCSCCIGCAKSYVNALESESCPVSHGEYSTVSPTGYQATPAYPVYYPPQSAYNQPSYNQPIYNSPQVPHYTTPLYPQATAYQPYGSPSNAQQQYQHYQHPYQQSVYSPTTNQPNFYQPDAANKV
eukprot:Phypoly_transcript_10589.p1 GENE.Phypoly_transcript_10589~~Phypoly_transcript_10589.p1  ORF type:complete len:262 (+),score=26.74 Phypoly_transcript_10589:153-938(+)